MSSKEPSTHLYGGPDDDNRQPPPPEGLRGESSAPAGAGRRQRKVGTMTIEKASATAAADVSISQEDRR